MTNPEPQRTRDDGDDAVPMRVVVLAGGLGTRLQEETDTRPKPMVEIGGRPIIWHIMKLYGSFGLSHFVVALGYRGEQIKSYFLNYRNLSRDLSVHTGDGTARVFDGDGDDWTVDLIDTGDATNTGGRVRRLAQHLPGENFCVTYGDGVTNADIGEIVGFHKRHGRMVTLMAVRPPARFGWLELEGRRVSSFIEKPNLGEGWVNGGFMVLRRDVLDHIVSDEQSLELDVIAPLAAAGEVMAYPHSDFWQPMDTLKDVRTLRALWEEGTAPWRLWR
ncbi:MAG TPA: glucose-1-phosphate cytidylyltransferase [Acidimicrobiales bacterium]|nr:glucose-1-phosphate cytidylyltransferase [Acidimicrobiales bacterium]